MKSWATLFHIRPRKIHGLQAAALLSELGSLSKDEGNGKGNARKQWSDWLNEEKQLYCTCGTYFSSVGFFDVSAKRQSEISNFSINDVKRQRQRHKLRIWLVEWGKTSVPYVWHALVNKSVSSSVKQPGDLASTTGTATTTPQIENLIGWRKNKRAIRAARTYEEVRAIVCKRITWNYHTTFFMTTWAFNWKCLILRIWFNSAHTNPVVGFFANNVKCEQDETIAKLSQLRKYLFSCRCCHCWVQTFFFFFFLFFLCFVSKR